MEKETPAQKIERLEALIDEAIKDLQYYCDWGRDSYIGPEGILDNLKDGRGK